MICFRKKKRKIQEQQIKELFIMLVDQMTINLNKKN